VDRLQARRFGSRNVLHAVVEEQDPRGWHADTGDDRVERGSIRLSVAEFGRDEDRVEDEGRPALVANVAVPAIGDDSAESSMDESWAGRRRGDVTRPGSGRRTALR